MKVVKDPEVHNIAVAMTEGVMGKDFPKEQRKRAAYLLHCGIKEGHLINYVHYECSRCRYADCQPTDTDCIGCGAKFIAIKDRIY